MSIARLIFATLIVLASLAFVYLGAKTIKVRDSWHRQVTNLNQQVDVLHDQNELLAAGDLKARETPLRVDEGRPVTEQLKTAKPGVQQLGVALHELLVDRGRVWDQCRPGRADPEKGEISVTIAAPTPHSIKDGSLLYVFEKADQNNPDAPTSGVFLGEFKVTGVNAQTVALAPAQRPTPRKLGQIGKSQGEWVLYETMPADRHSAFQGLNENELSKLIPSSSRPDYVRDGQEAPNDIPPELLGRVWVPNPDNKGSHHLVKKANAESKRDESEFAPGAAAEETYDLLEGKYVDGKFVAGKFYSRPLRDYALALRELFRDLWEMQDNVLAATTQVNNMQAAIAGLTGAGGQVELRDKEIATLKDDLQRVSGERDLVKKHAAAIDAQVVVLEKTIDRLLAANKQLADEWTAAQSEAARRIDALTGAVSAVR